MTRPLLFPLLTLLSLPLLACPPVRSGGDDDDAADDDDDDVGVDCPEVFTDAFRTLADWNTLSCSSVHIGASPDDSQTVALTLSWNLGGDPVAGMTYATDLSAGEAAFSVESGENLLHYDCNDALWLEEIVDRAFVATSGSVELTVTDGGGWDARATVSWQDVRLVEAATGASCLLPDQAWTDLPIGWLPG